MKSRIRRMLWSLLLVVSAAACGRSPAPVVEVSNAPPFVRRILDNPRFEWRMVERERMLVWAAEGSYAISRLDSLARAAESAREFALRQLGEPDRRDTTRASIFFLSGPDDFRAIVGQPAGGWTDAAANAVLFGISAEGGPPLRHELGHLYSHRRWGRPFAAWVSEGVAVYSVGHCANIPLHRWAAAIERMGPMPPLADLERNFDFSQAAPHLQAGSFMTWLKDNHGIDAVKSVFQGGLAAIQSATGASAATVESAWRAHLVALSRSLTDTLPNPRGRVRCEP